MEEQPSILWSYRTTPWDETGMIPFHLIYGGELVILVEIGISFARVSTYNADNAEKHLLEIDLVGEARDRAAAWLRAYK